MKIHTKAIWQEFGNVTVAALGIAVVVTLLTITTTVFAANCDAKPAYSVAHAVCHVGGDCASGSRAEQSPCTFTLYDQLLTCDCGGVGCHDNLSGVNQTSVGSTPYSDGHCVSGECTGDPGTKTFTASGYTKESEAECLE